MLVQAGCDQRPRCARPNVAFLADAMRERLSPVIAGASYVYGRAISREGGGMRRNAQNSVVPSEIREFQRARQSFSLLAQNKDWLAENFDKLIRVQDMLPQDDIVERNVDRRAVAETKEHILQCLEAALIMKWNTIPTALQQELFDPDGSPGDSPQTATLRGQIVRFLHDRKDDEN
jgi:uncharacterized protein (UPF0147 family)